MLHITIITQAYTKHFSIITLCLHCNYHEQSKAEGRCVPSECINTLDTNIKHVTCEPLSYVKPIFRLFSVVVTGFSLLRTFVKQFFKLCGSSVCAIIAGEWKHWCSASRWAASLKHFETTRLKTAAKCELREWCSSCTPTTLPLSLSFCGWPPAANDSLDSGEAAVLRS